MPSLIYKRGKKRIKASVMVKGIVRSKIFQDASEVSLRSATIWEDETRARMKAGVEMRLSDWIMDYLEDIDNRVTHKTFRSRHAILGRFQQVLDNCYIQDLSAAKIKDYLKTQKNRTGAARNDDLKNLSTAWEWGMENIPHFPQCNPFLVVKRYPRESKTRYVPPESDFWRVFEIASLQDQCILLITFTTAARPIEVFRLKFSDIDFEKNRIQLWSRKGTNNNYESRWVPIDDRLNELLKKWIKKRVNISGIKARNNVFISTYFNNFGDAFKERQYFMRELCREAGVKVFGLYGLRHLRAAIMYSREPNIRKLQRLLGHKKASTTDHYLQKQGLDLVDF